MNPPEANSKGGRTLKESTDKRDKNLEKNQVLDTEYC
jgi:hypothetical protein